MSELGLEAVLVGSRDFVLERIRKYGTYYKGDGWDLKCGQKSPWLFDLSLCFRYPAGMAVLAELVSPYCTTDFVGGCGEGANTIAAAVVANGGGNRCWFTVREQRKGRGADREYITGISPIYIPPNGGAPLVTLVEDVVTSGQTTIEAIRRIELSGCQVNNVVVLLDRQENDAIHEISLENLGRPVDVIFTKQQVLAGL